MCADHQGVGATFRHFSWALWMPCSGEYEPAAGLSMFPGYCALCFFPPSPLSVRNVSTPTLVCVVPPKFLYLWILKNLGSVGQALVYKAILRIMEFILSKSWLSRLYFSSPFQWSVYERAHVGWLGLSIFCSTCWPLKCVIGSIGTFILSGSKLCSNIRECLNVCLVS